jgi:replicative DNA helicase
MYQTERYLIGVVLNEGASAKKLINLTPDMFLYSAQGEFGSDHRRIWQMILDLHAKQQALTAINVATQLPDIGPYLLTLSETTPTFDAQTVLDQTQQQYLSALVRKFAVEGMGVASLADTPQQLEKTLTLPDVETHLFDLLVKLRQPFTNSTRQLTTLEDIRDELDREVDAALAGQTPGLLKFGMPGFSNKLLFPTGKITCLQGLSGCGKSSLAFQVVLGAALYLYANNLPGKILIQSIEMTSQEVFKSLASKLAGVDTTTILTATLSAGDAIRYRSALDLIQQLPIQINDQPLTTTALSLMAESVHEPHDPVVLLVTDYNELFSDDAPTNELRVSTIFRNQFFISRALGCAVLAVSQSTPSSDGSVSADSTRYSRSVLMASDVLVTLSNYEASENAGRKVVIPDGRREDRIYLDIHKYRGAPTGGWLEILWEPMYTRFLDPITQHAIAPALITTATQKAGLTPPSLPSVQTW